MKLKNIVISFFLLFVYSISFAHSLTFHEHGFYAEHQHEFIDVSTSEHHHDHHSHSDHLTTETAHFNHNDHCDEGILDLITCVLSDLTHHNHSDCHLDHQPNDDTKRLKSSNQSKIVSNSGTLFSPSIGYSFQLIQVNGQISPDFLSPLLDDSPLRGPPLFS